VRQRAAAYRDLSIRLLGREIPQVMLIHHNLLNTCCSSGMRSRRARPGFTSSIPEQTYADPVYALQPDRPAPGQSLLLSLARSRGWKLLPEFERLVDDGDFEIESLEKQGS
jgi:hypothetical protein